MRLRMRARREIFEAHYRGYQRAEKKDKGKILDEVAGMTGLHRDHLAHVLASYGKEQTVKGETRGRTATVSGQGVCGRIDAYLGGSRTAVWQTVRLSGRPWKFGG